MFLKLTLLIVVKSLNYFLESMKMKYFTTEMLHKSWIGLAHLEEYMRYCCKWLLSFMVAIHFFIHNLLQLHHFIKYKIAINNYSEKVNLIIKIDQKSGNLKLI